MREWHYDTAPEALWLWANNPEQWDSRVDVPDDAEIKQTALGPVVDELGYVLGEIINHQGFQVNRTVYVRSPEGRIYVLALHQVVPEP